MALQLLGDGLSVMDKMLNTGTWSVTMWQGVVTITHLYKQNKQDNCIFLQET